MLFSPETVQQLEEEHQTVRGKSAALFDAFMMTRTYNNPRAREHAHHGFLRRIKILVRCIDNTYELLPPNRADIPTSEEISNVTINLHAFMLNTFGCIDNLAWIWVCEKNITKENGAPLPNKSVGLKRTNKLVRRSLSPEFVTYLNTELGDWFDLIENYRDALAHRIPLYVPPYVVNTEDTIAAHRELDTRMADALNQGALDDYQRLLDEQEALGVFHPVMTHSIEEDARAVVFHSQLLADFNTIDALAWKMIDELDR